MAIKNNSLHTEISFGQLDVKGAKEIRLVKIEFSDGTDLTRLGAIKMWLIISVIYVGIYDISGNSPPGPTGLPFVGYYFYLSSKPYVDLQNLAKIYGPIFSSNTFESQSTSRNLKFLKVPPNK
ncbi:unnamed protein product [Larinioides sclopetarius]|uniref:Uncharacterized protein n=1 Tax=Larinioides sclopetarius TaxID=280406 RepID=A0AAV1YU73_9ARAC